MYGIYANIGDILMVNVSIYIYSIHGSYGYGYISIKTDPSVIMAVACWKMVDDFPAINLRG